MSKPSKNSAPSRAQLGKHWTTFEKELRRHIQESTEDFDAAIGAPSAGSGVWQGVPVVDSKTIAKASPIFEKLFGVPLDPDWIRPGGYTSTDDAVAHLKAEVFKNASATSTAGPVKTKAAKLVVAARKGR